MENKNQIQVIKGDLVHADVDLIVQQCNCLTVTAHGLSEYIKNQLKVDPYSKRRRLMGRRNCAIKEDRSQIGSVTIYRIKNHRPNYVACLFAQFCPGKSGVYYQDILNEHIDPLTNKVIIDDSSHRIQWFIRCLEQLAQRAEKLSCKKLAFPYKIGCGLAGGNWETYEKIIYDWSMQHQSKFEVIFFKND